MTGSESDAHPVSPGSLPADCSTDASDKAINQADAGTLRDPLQNQDSGHHGVTQSKIAVIGLMLLVTGVFGLPLLWINKRFSVAERVFWSLVMLAYTVAWIGVTIALVTWILQRLSLI